MKGMPKTPAPPAAFAPPPGAAPAGNGAPAVAASTAKALRPARLVTREKGKRIVINGVEGVGKTSLFSYAPDALMGMVGNETGYETLMLNGLVPQLDVLHFQEWLQAVETFRALADDTAMPYKNIGLDAMGGLERLCHEYVCETRFGDNWGEKGFGGYQRGYDQSITEWLKLLHEFDRLKDRGVNIIILSHVQVRPFKNPLGDDFDQYKADVHHKTWSSTHRWADAVLFMNFLTDVKEENGRKKGVGGTTRFLYTERRDAFDAKNRYGMPEMIQLPHSAPDMWPTLWHYLNLNSGKE